MQKPLLACALALALAGAATPVLAQSKGDWTLGLASTRSIPSPTTATS